MVVKRVLARAGLVDPVKVDLVLDPPDTYPGGPARGRVELVGGQAEARVTVPDLRLRTRAWKVDGEGDKRLASEVWGTFGGAGTSPSRPGRSGPSRSPTRCPSRRR